MRHVQAADSVVAEHDQCGFVGLSFQLLQAGWDLPHWDQRGAFDARDGKFLRFAHVNQCQRFSRVDPSLDVFRTGFYWEDRFTHEFEDSAVENYLAGRLGSFGRVTRWVRRFASACDEVSLDRAHLLGVQDFREGWHARRSAASAENNVLNPL